MTYSVSVRNKDNSEAATDVDVSIDLPTGLSFDNSSDCTAAKQTVTCAVNQIDPQDTFQASFSATVSSVGTLRVDAKTTASEKDNVLANNADSFSIESQEAIPQFAATLSIQQGPNAIGINDTVSHLLTVNNVGLADIEGALLTGSSDLATEISFPSDSCLGNQSEECTLDTVPAGESLSVPVTVKPLEAGLTKINIALACLLYTSPSPRD